jgi:hypothetical protein
MLVQLGMSATGNRALGAEFAIYAARAQRAMAKWVCRSVNDFLDRYTEWNLGPNATHAPLLHYEQAKPDGLSLADMVALIEAGALHVDPELEAWIRSEGGLPPAPRAPSAPELGDLSPEEVSLVQNSRNPPALPGAGPTQKPQLPTPANEPQVDAPTIASLGTLPHTLVLPERKLHRQPTENEIRAAVDFRSLDATQSNTSDALIAAFLAQVIPAQVRAIGQQIVNTKQGTPRKVLTKGAMASIQAPTDGGDVIDQHLLSAATAGAHAAAAELAAQSVTASIPSEDDLRARLSDQSTAIVAMAANGLSLSAQRKAASLIGGGRTPADVQAQTEAYLHGLNQQWISDQLRGSVTWAQNTGRAATFETADQTGLDYYSSELLDANTCEECAAVDGTQYSSLEDAEQDYAGSAGYVNCAGGPRCRGTLVAVAREQDPASSSSPVFTDAGS